jgi:hypothetical protein
MNTLIFFWIIGSIINYYFWKYDNRDNLMSSGFQPFVLLFSLLLSWIFLIMQIIVKSYEEKYKN